MIKVIIALLIGGGMAFTFWDYLGWRKAEWGNFGKGYEERMDEALKLTRMWQDTVVGVRVRYPDGWTVTQSSKLKAQSLVLNQRTEIMKVGDGIGEIEIEIEKKGGDLNQAAAEEEAGKDLIREKEFLNTEEKSMAVLTWEEGGEVVRRGMTYKGGRLVLMEARVPKELFDQYVKTFDEMMKSLVVI